MKEGYVERKIHMCIELVKNAISEAQKAVYQGYLESWQEKHKNQIISIKPPENVMSRKSRTRVCRDNEEEPEVIEESRIEPKIAEAEFKRKFPNKKAYYKRNGKTQITKAFKEFLISKQ